MYDPFDPRRRRQQRQARSARSPSEPPQQQRIQQILEAARRLQQENERLEQDNERLEQDNERLGKQLQRLQQQNQRLLAQAERQVDADRPQDSQRPARAAGALPDDAETLQARLRTLSQRYVDLEQDLDRARQRADQAAEQARRQERDRILGDLLEIPDALDRALEQADSEGSPWYRGTASVLRQVVALLDRHGIERFGERGDAFDPRQHEAVGTAPAGDLPEGHVASVQQPGYRTDEALLRPARVVVTRAP